MSAPELISRLFQARTAAHMAHLRTKSYAEHKALDEFYNEIIELADEFAETYQGFFGLMDYPAVPQPTGKPVDWINALREWCKQNRNAICKGESVLENLLDSIMGFCAQIVYKLKFLDSGCADMDGGGDMPMPDGFMKMAKW